MARQGMGDRKNRENWVNGLYSSMIPKYNQPTQYDSVWIRFQDDDERAYFVYVNRSNVRVGKYGGYNVYFPPNRDVYTFSMYPLDDEKDKNGFFKPEIISKLESEGFSVQGRVAKSKMSREDLMDRIQNSIDLRKEKYMKRTYSASERVELNFPLNYLDVNNDKDLVVSKTGCYYGMFPLKEEVDGSYTGRIFIPVSSVEIDEDAGLVYSDFEVKGLRQRTLVEKLDLDQIDFDFEKVLADQKLELNWDGYSPEDVSVAPSLGDGTLIHAEKSDSSTSSSVRYVSDEHTAKYHYPNIDLTKSEMYAIKVEKEQPIFEAIEESYNQWIDYVNKNNIEVKDFVPVEFSSSMSLNDFYVSMREARDLLVTVADEHAAKNGKELPIDDLCSDDFVLRTTKKTKVKKSYEEETMKFNEDRGLSLYEDDGKTLKTADIDEKRFISSYGVYALSPDEQDLLAKGEEIVLTNVANPRNTKFLNLRCKLEELPLKDARRKEENGGCTHIVTVVAELDVTSEDFANYNLNEKYRLYKSDYDKLIYTIDQYKQEYERHCEQRQKKAKAVGKTSEELDRLKKSQNIVKTVKENNRWDNGVKEVKVVNYVKASFIAKAGLVGPIVKHRDEDLLLAAKVNMLNLPASKKGHDELGFETLYDEKLWECRLNEYSGYISEKEEILKLCIEKGQTEEQIQSISRVIETYRKLQEMAEKEGELRRQPADESYQKLGFKNQWEQFVYETSEANRKGRQSEDVYVRIKHNDEKARMFEEHRERLDKILAVRGFSFDKNETDKTVEFSNW